MTKIEGGAQNFENFFQSKIIKTINFSMIN